MMSGTTVYNHPHGSSKCMKQQLAASQQTSSYENTINQIIKSHFMNRYGISDKKWVDDTAAQSLTNHSDNNHHYSKRSDATRNHYIAIDDSVNLCYQICNKKEHREYAKNNKVHFNDTSSLVSYKDIHDKGSASQSHLRLGVWEFRVPYLNFIEEYCRSALDSAAAAADAMMIDKDKMVKPVDVISYSNLIPDKLRVFLQDKTKTYHVPVAIKYIKYDILHKQRYDKYVKQFCKSQINSLLHQRSQQQQQHKFRDNAPIEYDNILSELVAIIHFEKNKITTNRFSSGFMVGNGSNNTIVEANDISKCLYFMLHYIQNLNKAYHLHLKNKNEEGSSDMINNDNEDDISCCRIETEQAVVSSAAAAAASSRNKNQYFNHVFGLSASAAAAAAAAAISSDPNHYIMKETDFESLLTELFTFMYYYDRERYKNWIRSKRNIMAQRQHQQQQRQRRSVGSIHNNKRMSDNAIFASDRIYHSIIMNMIASSSSSSSAAAAANTQQNQLSFLLGSSSSSSDSSMIETFDFIANYVEEYVMDMCDEYITKADDLTQIDLQCMKNEVLIYLSAVRFLLDNFCTPCLLYMYAQNVKSLSYHTLNNHSKASNNNDTAAASASESIDFDNNSDNNVMFNRILNYRKTSASLFNNVRYIVLEQQKLTFSKFIEVNYNRFHDIVTNSLLFMLMYTLACFQMCGLQHNDLHTSNYFIEEYNPPIPEMFFRVDVNYAVRLTNVRYVPKIYDYDRSSLFPNYEILPPNVRPIHYCKMNPETFESCFKEFAFHNVNNRFNPTWDMTVVLIGFVRVAEQYIKTSQNIKQKNELPNFFQSIRACNATLSSVCDMLSECVGIFPGSVYREYDNRGGGGGSSFRYVHTVMNTKDPSWKKYSVCNRFSPYFKKKISPTTKPQPKADNRFYYDTTPFVKNKPIMDESYTPTRFIQNSNLLFKYFINPSATALSLVRWDSVQHLANTFQLPCFL